MERQRISLFEKLPLINEVLPYTDYSADRLFLLLSTLSVKTRKRLNEAYHQFRNLIKGFEKVVCISPDQLLLLPSDLFRFSFSIRNREDTRNFIRFIDIAYENSKSEESNK